MICMLQDAEHLEFIWSCAQMRQVGVRSAAQKCTDTSGKPVHLPSFVKTKLVRPGALTTSKSMKFVPRKLKLRRKAVYVFKVLVRVKAGSMGCYNTAREASATASVEIAAGGQDRLAPLKIAVCSKYPCTCAGDENERRRFNRGSKVVLRACSTELMQSHAWTATSRASMAGASFTSPTGGGTSKQELVTVMIDSPISQNFLEP